MSLDKVLLESLISPAVRGRFERFELVEQTGSTNSDLMASAVSGWELRVAELQTAGRGRRDKQWQSVPGAGLAFSLAVPLQGDAQHVSLLPLVIGAACVTALRRLDYPVALKWPNDLVHARADGHPEKLGGILCELRHIHAQQWRAVCGIGINVSPAAVPADVTATCLSAIGPSMPRERLLAELLTTLVGVLESGVPSFPLLANAARAFDALDGHAIDVIEPQRTWSGIARGWDDHGRLLVEAATGELHALLSAEVSVRAA